MNSVFLMSEWTAIAGLVLSLGTHVSSLLGLRPPFEKYVWGLHFVLFVLAIPAMWAVHKLSGHLKGWAYWKSAFSRRLTEVVLRGCPRWVQKFLTYLLAYVVVHMGILLARSVGQTNPPEIVVGQTPLDFLAASSAGWMFAYAALAAIFYSILHVEDDAATRTQQ